MSQALITEHKFVTTTPGYCNSETKLNASLDFHVFCVKKVNNALIGMKRVAQANHVDCAQLQN